MVEVVRTNFAPIFSDFENFLWHSGTYRSAILATIFKSVLFTGKCFSSPKKNAQTASKSAYKRRRYLLLNNVIRPSVIYEQKSELETKAMPTSRHCNTGRTCFQLPITTTEKTSLPIHVVQKITIIRVQKIGKSAV